VYGINGCRDSGSQGIVGFMFQGCRTVFRESEARENYGGGLERATSRCKCSGFVRSSMLLKP